MATPRCFHCREDVPAGVALTVALDGEPQPVCCAGCQAAAEFIRDAGLGRYYDFRAAPAPRPEPVADDAWTTYDRAEIQARLVTRTGAAASVNLLLEGLRCPACGWLVERRLERVAGVAGIAVNPASARARLEWRSSEVALSALLRTIHELGYRPHLLGATDTLEVAARERRVALRRLAVAGLGMMQVMMFAVGLYAGAFSGMDPLLREYLRLVSLLVATPVLFYAGRPFLEGAWRALAARTPGMDVPVAAALLLAWSASVWNTLRGSGEVYFDSVTMFVFLLLLGRYAEMVARHQAGSTNDALVRLLPASALRIRDGRGERVAVADLAAGDEVAVPAGETFPADGTLCDGPALADESLLTGESAAVTKAAGDAVIGGSVNAGGPVRLRVTAAGHDTVLAGIVRLLERAQTERPALARLADRWANWFVAIILLATLAVAATWLVLDPPRAFATTLAVLVVSCPCALSLATPTALTVATARLARRGLLVTRADAVEALARADTIVFDKTGTLTVGRPVIRTIAMLGPADADYCRRAAAALEWSSAHPLALAFRNVQGALPQADAVHAVAGGGLEARLDGELHRIGSRDFVAALAGPAELPDCGLYLGRAGAWLARFEVEDALRPEAARAVADLAGLGLRPVIASGDHAPAVAAAANAIGVAEYHARLGPADKLRLVQALEQQDRQVAMVGDGVNDAPVLAAARVSIAIGAGAAIARTSADLVLIARGLGALPEAVRMARRTVTIIRQNLAWAAGYNLVALPLAAAGLVPPWLAAIGMSASSLLVVANAWRLA
ncbi:MAG: cadmium-translocating P-type ATPase [Gammaproteobacteria bacterium]|nr:cadmium-translocating P-type ATPase [Gammaproteobacteria bacterium]